MDFFAKFKKLVDMSTFMWYNSYVNSKKERNMAIKVVLFDLDGTLLPMDQDLFLKTYMGKISRRMASFGYEPRELISSIMLGTRDMILNDGANTNEKVFWERFCKIYGENALGDMEKFDAFYVEEFDSISSVCGHTPKALQTVNAIKKMGYRVALATNPVFPSIATEKRIAWAGFSTNDFEIFTTYENSHSSKPNLDYYREVAQKLNVLPEECLMVGNDVSDDMVARELGMKVFLLTDCLINKENADISEYPNGSFEELMSYIENIR